MWTKDWVIQEKEVYGFRCENQMETYVLHPYLSETDAFMLHFHNHQWFPAEINYANQESSVYMYLQVLLWCLLFRTMVTWHKRQAVDWRNVFMSVIMLSPQRVMAEVPEIVNCHLWMLVFLIIPPFLSIPWRDKNEESTCGFFNVRYESRNLWIILLWWWIRDSIRCWRGSQIRLRWKRGWERVSCGMEALLWYWILDQCAASSLMRIAMLRGV